MAIEGVDYSAGGFPGSAALKAADKAFAVRYVVGDLAPEGRGLTVAERAELEAGGIEVVAVYEGTANRMQGGQAAGIADAKTAQACLVAAGLPPTMPIYFACDFDATPGDQVAIDAYLQGAASVLGAARVGVYGGYWVVSRCAANKTAAWFWQTSAWSGGQWFAGNHLEQYAYNQYINGVNCDATRAKQDAYGQASKFRGGNPVPTPAPAPKPVVNYPEGMDAGVARFLFGSFKASNGVTVQYSEGDELSALWLASGRYGRITNVLISVDSPTITRIYWQVGDVCYWRPNANAPIRLMK